MASEITDHEAEQFESYLREKKVLGVGDPRVSGGNLREVLKKVLGVLVKVLPLFLAEAPMAAEEGVVGAPRVGWETIKRLLEVSPDLFATVLQLVTQIREALDAEPGLKGS